mmetsp:Transcript_47210/g.151523  ORF Transcript_47210/g.151523 Transcript_47210/m.151523 type:complete len:204 (-) Transcript_47210:449-1060(-)
MALFASLPSLISVGRHGRRRPSSRIGPTVARSTRAAGAPRRPWCRRPRGGRPFSRRPALPRLPMQMRLVSPPGPLCRFSACAPLPRRSPIGAPRWTPLGMRRGRRSWMPRLCIGAATTSADSLSSTRTKSWGARAMGRCRRRRRPRPLGPLARTGTTHQDAKSNRKVLRPPRLVLVQGSRSATRTSLCGTSRSTAAWSAPELP